MITELFRTIRVMLLFGKWHHATLSMMPGRYVRQPGRDELVVGGTETWLTIAPFGSLYTVTKTDYVANKPEREETLIATFSWHASGYLIELGGDRCFVFNPAAQSLYIETLTREGTWTTELFNKISDQ